MMVAFWLLSLSWAGDGTARPCVSSPWVIQETLDLSGVLTPDTAWRLTQIYRPSWERHGWVSHPVPALPGTPICAGDVVETWQRARTVIALRPAPGVPGVFPDQALASVVGEAGTVLEFRGDIVQRRGTATYLLPDAMPDLSVLAMASAGRWLKVSDARSTFQLSVSEGCEPDVQVTVSGDEDPWAIEAAVAHRVTVEVLDREGSSIGEPVVVKEGEVRRLLAGQRRLTPLEDPAALEEVRDGLEACTADLRRPLSQRQTPPPPEAWPTLEARARLRVRSEGRPRAVQVDGAPWAPGAWWPIRGAAGGRVWEAARPLRWTPGTHVVVVERRGGEPIVWRGEGRAGEGRAGEVEQIIVLEGPELLAHATPASSTVGGPTGRVMTTRNVPETMIEFLELSGGTFQMGRPERAIGDGDELPQHAVTVSAVAIGRTEVTKAQWAAVVNAAQAAGDTDAAKLKVDPSSFEEASQPVEQVSWCDAVRFANALSRLEARRPAYTVGADCEEGGAVAWDRAADGYRLPTEAEWEYAARAGTTTAYFFGETPDGICRFANIADLTGKGRYPDWTAADCADNAVETAAVCSYAANPWGFCDILGNLSEWVWDWYDSGYYAASPNADPAGPADPGIIRVLRGGSWASPPVAARTTYREGWGPSGSNGVWGFRLVLPVDVSGR